jgi:hypothetical protein
MLDKINDYDREYYENKKEKFVNDTLDEPYSEKEIVEFETDYDVKIPETLRKYLINISRELFIGSKPNCVHLDIEHFYLDKNGTDKNMPKELHDRYYNSINYYEDMEDELHEYLLGLEEIANPLGYSLNYCLSIDYIDIIKDKQRHTTNIIYLCIKGPFYGQCLTCDQGSHVKRWFKHNFHII